jgi:RecB family exonuclease
VITPRRTRLVRVPDLQGFRRAVATLGVGVPASPEPVVVVPTRSAAKQLARSLDGAILVTRDELYDRLHTRLADPPRRLTALERDVMAQASARATAVDRELTFQLRPGLVAEMLRFYDQLRRQSQQVNRFEELISEALGSDEIDRGARRMRQQTQFLAALFRDYERRVRESGACDEHVLRERLIAEAAPHPVRRIVVTMADWIADADGLFVADFDLLTRIPGLAALDLVATDGILASGFHERLHDWWPGLDEVRIDDLAPAARSKPQLIVPPDANPDEPWWTHRDREEEIVAVARQVKADRRAGDGVPLDRVAVVYKGPLPYLYLAAEVFGSAGIPFQTGDALPLAAEPTAAAIDLILDVVDSNFTRAALVALLRSPHFLFVYEGVEVSRPSTSVLDRALSARRYLGDPGRLEALAEDWTAAPAAPALAAALAIARELAPLREVAPASSHIERLLSFWTAHLRPIDDDHASASRERRARAAVADGLGALAAVHAAHDDSPWTIESLALHVRRAIEEQTFDLESRGGGVQLVDDRAARYGEFDDVAVVGLVDAEWPERTRRNIFYPPALLKALGWPSEKDRRAAANAHFLDLLGSASRRTTLSVFTLDDDAIVPRSMQLDEVPRARLSVVARPAVAQARVFVDESLSLEPRSFAPLDPHERVWAELRASRTGQDDSRFHGTVANATTRTWTVSALETYLGCPFRFFAQHVLRLEEEPDDEEIMDPRRQGQFVHNVFERFFDAWQGAGLRAITSANLDDARTMFTAVVDRALGELPQAEGALERTRLLGSPAAAGLGDAVMRMEAERPTPVVERLLEYELKGEFAIRTADDERTVALRGKADRLDLLADGTFRLIDYKLGWPPDRRKALQLPIYSICAEQQLRPYRGRNWTMSEAAYLAFKGPRRVVPLFQNPPDREKVLAEAQDRLVKTIDAIAAGQFPPTPDDVYRCETCSYAAVCRKDYVGEV